MRAWIRHEIDGLKDTAFALLKEFGPPGKRGANNTGFLAKYKALNKELARFGLKHKLFSKIYVRKLRDTAAWLSKHDIKISSDIPFTVCIEAGNAETFLAAQREAKQRKLKFDVPFIQQFKERRRRDAEEKNRRKHGLNGGRTDPEAIRLKYDGLSEANDTLERLNGFRRRVERHASKLSDQHAAELFDAFDKVDTVVSAIKKAVRRTSRVREFRRMKIIVDSGAYTAWKTGDSINLADYISFIKTNSHLIDSYINLDIIPSRSEWRTKYIERAAQQSYDNQQRMKAAGLSPIPVFHPGEDFDRLKRYLADGEPKIALSVKGNQYKAMKWLDDCFTIIGTHPVRVHGLGTNSVAILHEHPFETVDASTWLIQSGDGQVPIARYTDDKPDYSVPHQIVSVTDKSFKRDNHIAHLPTYELDRAHRFLNNEVGITLEQARDKLEYRQRCWLVCLRGLQASCGTQIVPVSALGKSYRPLLLEYGFENHLLSYYELRTAPSNALQNYVTG